MSDHEAILRRVFIDYDRVPEPPKFPPKYDEPSPPTNEDVARNVEQFPDLYLSLKHRAERFVASAFERAVQVVTSPHQGASTP